MVVMGRHLVVAAGVGAACGAAVSVAVFAAVTFGVDMYFRVAGWRDMRREQRSAT